MAARTWLPWNVQALAEAGRGGLRGRPPLEFHPEWGRAASWWVSRHSWWQTIETWLMLAEANVEIVELDN